MGNGNIKGYSTCSSYQGCVPTLHHVMKEKYNPVTIYAQSVAYEAFDTTTINKPLQEIHRKSKMIYTHRHEIIKEYRQDDNLIIHEFDFEVYMIEEEEDEYIRSQIIQEPVYTIHQAAFTDNI